MTDISKSRLVTAAKITGGFSALVGMLIMFSGAFVKLAGLQTTEAANTQHRQIIEESREIDRAILRELRHLTGVMECNYRQVAWENCPTVKERAVSNGFIEIL